MKTFTLTGIILCLLKSASSTLSSSSPSVELNYAVVVDAGSSGSRAYLYTWPEHSGNPHELLSISPLMNEQGFPIYKKVKPGLSSLQDDPHSALAYITPLLDFALGYIPKEKVHETPLYILATAGMRMVEKQKADAIIQALRTGINENYEFLFPEGNLEVITGKQEGLYQWMAINYVLGKFTSHVAEEPSQLEALPDPNVVVIPEEDSAVIRPRTVGAIDMGGASMQIAMEITSQLQLEGLSDQERSQVAEINLGCKDHDTEHTYRVFVTTFLGFGANEALARHQRDLIFAQMDKGVSNLLGLSPSKRLRDPCLAHGFMDNVTLTLQPDAYNLEDKYKSQLLDAKTLYLVGTGEWSECVSSLKDFTRTREKYTKCEGSGSSEASSSSFSCPDDAIKIPEIQFENSEFYGFSEFWYSMEDVLGMGGPYLHKSFAKEAQTFCETSWPVIWNRFTENKYPKADKARLETQCFKSAWLVVALHNGFQFPDSYSHLSAAPEAVNGKVVHWTLGALLYRTRFLPLRAIESHSLVHHGVYHSAFASGYLYSHYVVFFCLVLVIAAILLYLQRLKRFVKPSTLRKVPTFFLPASANTSPTGSYPTSPAGEMEPDDEADVRPLLLGVEATQPCDYLDAGSRQMRQSKSVASFFL